MPQSSTPCADSSCPGFSRCRGSCRCGRRGGRRGSRRAGVRWGRRLSRCSGRVRSLRSGRGCGHSAVPSFWSWRSRRRCRQDSAHVPCCRTPRGWPAPFRLTGCRADRFSWRGLVLRRFWRFCGADDLFLCCHGYGIVAVRYDYAISLPDDATAGDCVPVLRII
jgi:hypothetical protein